MELLKMLNLGIRFLLEICALIAIGYGGFYLGKGIVLKVLLAIGAPLLAAILWGTFVSPKAQIPLQGSFRLMMELLIFGAGALSLYITGHTRLAMLFSGLVLLNLVLMYIWKQ